MRTLALCGASCKRRSFFYVRGQRGKSLQLLPLLMVEGCVGRSWAVWTGAMGFADELRHNGVLRSSPAGDAPSLRRAASAWPGSTTVLPQRPG